MTVGGGFPFSVVAALAAGGWRGDGLDEVERTAVFSSGKGRHLVQKNVLYLQVTEVQSHR